MTIFERLLPFLLVGSLTGCVPPPDADEAESELSVRHRIDKTAGAMIQGSSPDRRRIAYATPCDAEGNAATELRILDDWTGKITTVATGARCMPGQVQFSPDGVLAAFSKGDGVINVYNASSGVTKTVSRAGQSGVGVAFSPDSRWLVVTSMGEPSMGGTLDAWDADLGKHVEIATGAFFNPFAQGPYQSFQFSPDGKRLLYIGGLTSPFPIGALSIWTRKSASSQVIATGVPATSYVVTADWLRLAYVRGVVYTPGAPPADLVKGDLVVRDLSTGVEDAVESGAAVPIAFLHDGDALVYASGAVPGQQAVTLKARLLDEARTVTLDTGVFQSFGTLGGLAFDPYGDRVAYVANVDFMTFSGELRVATLPACARPPAAPRSVAKQVVPMAFGFAAGGSKLIYLHDPLSTFPGAAAGTLSSFDGKSSTVLGTNVTQIALHFDPAADELLFESAYDANLAAGDLRVHNARTNQTRLLGHDAAVLSVDRSPNGAYAGYLMLTRSPIDGTPPTATLELARVRANLPTQSITRDVTSLATANAGRVLYTTAKGLYGADE